MGYSFFFLTGISYRTYSYADSNGPAPPLYSFALGLNDLLLF